MKDMQNTLIDNSDQFRLVNYLNELANDTKCNESIFVLEIIN